MTKIYNKQEMRFFRKKLRNNPTPEELKFWFILKDYFPQIRARRQYSFSGYIVDFYIKKYRIIIEIDGQYHLNQQEYDLERERFLKEHTRFILRFSNEEIYDKDYVINTLQQYFIQECLELQAPLTKGSSAKR